MFKLLQVRLPKQFLYYADLSTFSVTIQVCLRRNLTENVFTNAFIKTQFVKLLMLLISLDSLVSLDHTHGTNHGRLITKWVGCFQY